MRRIPGIYHMQKTYCICFACDEEILVDEVRVADGADFHKVDPLRYGWYPVCPKHKCHTASFIDGELVVRPGHPTNQKRNPQRREYEKGPA